MSALQRALVLLAVPGQKIFFSPSGLLLSLSVLLEPRCVQTVPSRAFKRWLDSPSAPESDPGTQPHRGREVISTNLGKHFLEPPGFNLEKPLGLRKGGGVGFRVFGDSCVAVAWRSPGPSTAAMRASRSSSCCRREPIQWPSRPFFLLGVLRASCELSFFEKVLCHIASQVEVIRLAQKVGMNERYTTAGAPGLDGRQNSCDIMPYYTTPYQSISVSYTTILCLPLLCYAMLCYTML